MRTNALSLVLLAAAIATFAACNCGGGDSTDLGDAGSEQDSGAVLDDASTPIEDGGAPGDSGTATDGGSLDAGASDSGTPICLSVGAACTAASECCTRSCAGTCQDTTPNSTLEVLGSQCTTSAQCASANCQGGLCTQAYSCRSNYDTCTRHSDCCNRNCRNAGGGYVDDGVGPGFCSPLSGGCAVDGQPCTDGSGCCSKTCADQGFGVKVCAPAGGCRIEDTPCTTASECCSMGASPTPPTCSAKPSASTATLCSVSGCNPAGMVCGKADLPDGGSVTVSARAPSACCDGDQKTCKVDRAGIPRCFGGQTVQCPTGFTGQPGCCIAEGAVCAFSDQCCNGNPCLPGDGGVLRCTARATCKGLGSSCTAGSTTECCAGSVCATQIEGGSVCAIPTQTDAGTTSCKPNGTGASSSCTSADQCCSKLCVGGFCSAPASCQPLGTGCTASADCCTGLACNIASGQTAGTCQSSSCQSAGQSCSPTLNCCTGNICRDGAGATCTGASPCTCMPQIG